MIVDCEMVVGYFEFLIVYTALHTQSGGFFESKERKEQEMNFGGIIFDLDGTLLDTLDDLADAMNRVLSGMGYSTHPVDAYRYFVGEGIHKLAFRVLPESNRDESTVGDVVEAMRRDYGKHWAEKTRPYEGVMSMLKQFEEWNVPTAILSNKPEEFTVEVVDRLLANRRFSVVRGARENQPLKPNPVSALEVAKEMAIEPGRLVFVGDTATDMRTASAAGMYGVGVLWGFRQADELVSNGARLVIEKPSDLLKLFE